MTDPDTAACATKTYFGSKLRERTVTDRTIALVRCRHKPSAVLKVQEYWEADPGTL